jgi:hypothetical protein
MLKVNGYTHGKITMAWIAHHLEINRPYLKIRLGDRNSQVLLILDLAMCRVTKFLENILCILIIQVQVKWHIDCMYLCGSSVKLYGEKSTGDKLLGEKLE